MSSIAPPLPTRGTGYPRPGEPLAGNPERARPKAAVWPATLLFYTCFLPPEVHVDLGTMRIYAYRALLILLIPFVARKIARGEVKLSLIDASVVLSGLWFILAMSAHYGLGNGIEQGGALSLDLIMAFMVARSFITDVDALRRVLLQSVWAVLAAGVIMMVESVSGQLILRPLLGKIFGVDQTAAALVTDRRFGLVRAYGPFPHPILGGLQMSSLIPLYGFVAIRSTKRLAGLVGAFMGLFALSSAAFIGVALNLGMMSYEMIRRRVSNLNWPLVGWSALLVMLALQFLSKNGVIFVIIRYLTLDPATGNYRVLIWTYGMQDVLDNPIWGVGRESWDRPSFMITESIDAHWLWLSLRYGLPASITLITAAVSTLVLLVRKVSATPESRERQAMIGIWMSLFTLLMLMFTVTLWSNSMAWLVMLMGSALSIAKSGSNYPAIKVRKPRTKIVFGRDPEAFVGPSARHSQVSE